MQSTLFGTISSMDAVLLERIQINRSQFVANFNHKDKWVRACVAESNLTHIIMQFDRDWLDDNYPEIVFSYLGEHYLKHIAPSIEEDDCPY